MGAIREPGPWYHAGIEVGVEGPPGDLGDIYTVALCANNPAISTCPDSNMPIPSLAMISWLAKQGIDFETLWISDWDFLPVAIPHFKVNIMFLHPQDAMLFKLTWGGK